MTNDSGAPLRIAVVAPPFYEVPPRSYGGTELVCALLVEGLVERGHDVTLVAAGADRTRATFVQTFPTVQPEATESSAAVEVLHAAKAAAALEAIDVDLVHDHTLAGALTAATRAAPTVVTVHAPVSGPDSRADTFRALGRWAPLVALSEAQRRGAPDLSWIGTVHNGIPVEHYPFRERKEDFVLFLGRIGPHKGAHVAIQAAREAGRRLVLAGAWTVPSERTYFDEYVRPLLGPDAEWVGEVEAETKKSLLAQASCLLFPAQWDEPFGLVLVEAMVCGTPVVGLRAGSVPEIVADGETGVLCDRASDLPAAIRAAAALDPAKCRAHVAEHFSVERMVERYDALYRAVVAAGLAARGRR